ncbi:hypothetical protein Bca4012_038999 [Brassica carinata]
MRAAFVRSRVSSNGAGERLYRALADKEDTTVDQLHEHLTEEFPFEHNTWSGGVKADDISVNNEAHRSDDEADPDACSEREDGEAGIEGCLDSGADSPSRGGQSSVRPGAVPISGRNTSASVGQLVPLLEGYMGRIKEHITAEFGSIRTEVAATTSSVAALESFIKTEFASPHQNEAPAGATSVDRQHDHGDSFPISTRNDGTQSDVPPADSESILCRMPAEWPTQFVSKLRGFARVTSHEEDTIDERPMDMDEVKHLDRPSRSPFLRITQITPHVKESGASNEQSQHRETTPLSQSIAPLPSNPPPIASEISVPITISPSVSTPAQSDPVGEETVIVPEEMY